MFEGGDRVSVKLDFDTVAAKQAMTSVVPVWKQTSRELKTGSDQATDGLDKTTESVWTLKNAVIALSAIYIGKRLFDFGADMVGLAAEEAKQSKKLEAVLRATGGAAGYSAGELKAYAGELQNVTTFGDETIVGAQAVLASFNQINGPVFREATERILDLSILLDTDLKSSALQVGKALQEPIEGLTALRRSGVSFSEEQKKQIADFVGVNDLASAQKVILEGLATNVGGLAREMASDTFGQFEQTMNNLSDVGEGAGFGIAAGFQNILNAITLTNRGTDDFWYRLKVILPLAIEDLITRVGYGFSFLNSHIASQAEGIGTALRLVGLIGKEQMNDLRVNADKAQESFIKLEQKLSEIQDRRKQALKDPGFSSINDMTDEQFAAFTAWSDSDDQRVETVAAAVEAATDKKLDEFANKLGQRMRGR